MFTVGATLPNVNSLVFYYDPANTKSYPDTGVTLTDLVGVSDQATLTGEGPTISNGIIYLNNNGYLDIPWNSFSQDNFSIVFWFKTDSTTTTFCNTYWNTPRIIMSLDSSGNFQFNLRGWNGIEVVNITAASSGTDYRNGQWHHAAAIRSGDDLYVYIDGELVGGATGVNDADPHTDRSSIGFGASGPYTADYTPAYIGYLGLIMLYDGQALNATEVRRLYHAHRGRYA